MTTIKKKTAKWVSIILSVMMAFAFMPLLGTQEAYAIPIEDTLTIDVSHGTWTAEDADQSKAVREFLWDSYANDTIDLNPYTNEFNDAEEIYYPDFDKDGVGDVVVNVDTDSWEMTIERTEKPSIEEVIIEMNAEKLAEYAEMAPAGYGYDDLAYYYKDIHFIISDFIKVKDSLTIDLTQGSQTFSDAEAAAVKVMLDEMSDKGIINGEGIEEEGRYWYNFDKNETNEIGVSVNGSSIELRVTDTCSIGKFTLKAPDGWAEEWALKDAGTNGLKYVYKSITFNLTDCVEIKDNKVINLYDGVQAIDGPEGYAVGFFLYLMAEDEVIDVMDETYDPSTNINEIWFDLDKNRTADIHVCEDFAGNTPDTFKMKIEKTATCSVAKTVPVVASDEFVEHWTMMPLDSSEAESTKYMYKKITFNMAKAVTPTVILSKKSFTYNGKTQKPAVTVKVGSRTLTGADYTVVNKGRKDAGKGTVKVTLKGNYYGGKTVTYTINKAKNPLAVTGKTATVMYSKVKNADQKLALYKVIKTTKKGKGTVTYTKKSGNGKITIAKKTGKVTVKKGIKKGTYTVKVNVRAAGTKNYKALTKTVTFKIKVK